MANRTWAAADQGTSSSPSWTTATCRRRRAWLAEHAGRALVVLRADSHETQLWAAACGCGLALLPRFRAEAEPALRRIATPAPVPPAEVWLGVHGENRRLSRVRTVLDCIAEAVRSRAAMLNPSEPAGGAAHAAASRESGGR